MKENDFYTMLKQIPSDIESTVGCRNMINTLDYTLDVRYELEQGKAIHGEVRWGYVIQVTEVDIVDYSGDDVALTQTQWEELFKYLEICIYKEECQPIKT